MSFILKRQLMENLFNLGRLNFNFKEIWKNNLENKYVCFQNVIIILQILFAHDLTVICAVEKSSESFMKSQNY
jgi:hypothetical protein